MGMFDNIQCKYSLPLPEELQSLSTDWSTEMFQTKDLANLLGSYTISEEGFLFEEIVEREYVPYTDAERAEIKPKPWSVWKDVIVKNSYSKKIEHHGEVTFYSSFASTDAEDCWLEFTAYFIYGKLDKISLVRNEKIMSQRLHNEKWNIKRKEEESKLWYRFKQQVKPYGWRLFWSKVSKLCAYVARMLNKLEYAILRHML
jgi:hypothetical protein